MPFLHYSQAVPVKIREGAERRLISGDQLMMVIFDFNDGPQSEPDPPHAHPHEQTSYVVEGEINFFLEDQCEHLKAGDLILIPSGMPHAIQLLTEHVRLVDSFSPVREDFLK